jgi:HAD superfamily hydrolase (TIGR01509 family)
MLWLEAAAAHAPVLFPGVEEMLDELGSLYTLGIVTSGSRSRVVNDLNRLSIAHRFAIVITGDDITDPKPAPESLEMALVHLDLSPGESLYVGDAHADFEMSRAAGVTFIGVPSEFANLTDDHPEYDVHPIASLPRVIESLK